MKLGILCNLAALFLGLTLFTACDLEPTEDEVAPVDDQASEVQQAPAALHRCGLRTCERGEMCCTNHCQKLLPNRINQCRNRPDNDGMQE